MKRKILVVESELSIRMMLEHFLSDEYDVIAVENGYEALSWIQHGNHANLLLVDTDMTMINAREFEHSIKKQKGMSCVPVIMFAASNKNIVHTNHLIQPLVNPKEIITKINAALGRAAA